jgi:hypothetical protein
MPSLLMQQLSQTLLLKMLSLLTQWLSQTLLSPLTQQLSPLTKLRSLSSI